MIKGIIEHAREIIDTRNPFKLMMRLIFNLFTFAAANVAIVIIWGWTLYGPNGLTSKPKEYQLVVAELAKELGNPLFAMNLSAYAAGQASGWMQLFYIMLPTLLLWTMVLFCMCIYMSWNPDTEQD